MIIMNRSVLHELKVEYQYRYQVLLDIDAEILDQLVKLNGLLIKQEKMSDNYERIKAYLKDELALAVVDGDLSLTRRLLRNGNSEVLSLVNHYIKRAVNIQVPHIKIANEKFTEASDFLSSLQDA